jgi:hypothetical protein
MMLAEILAGDCENRGQIVYPRLIWKDAIVDQGEGLKPTGQPPPDTDMSIVIGGRVFHQLAERCFNRSLDRRARSAGLPKVAADLIAKPFSF